MTRQTQNSTRKQGVAGFRCEQHHARLHPDGPGCVPNGSFVGLNGSLHWCCTRRRARTHQRKGEFLSRGDAHEIPHHGVPTLLVRRLDFRPIPSCPETDFTRKPGSSVCFPGRPHFSPCLALRTSHEGGYSCVSLPYSLSVWREI